ncbi:MAG TPA: porin [Gammaproteobacteria bacterium]|nr:porin [Gammaproteobacteria bacterium]
MLPDDRADALYHSYDGGGIEISGPSLLVLKKLGQNVAVTGNYYVDSVSSASIDVVTRASPYTEERTEFSGGIDYLHGNSVMSLSYTNSTENDYDANTASFGISMDMFGNMTTLSLGYAHGWDTVRRSDLLTFSEDVRRHNYRLGLSQVITKDMILEANYEGITDEGLLRNPYREYRFLIDPLNPDAGTSWASEMYPSTRTSSAVTLRSKYYLPWRAALSGEYRFFADTWGIDAHTLKFGYTHPLSGGWQVEGTYRYYTQTAADFYSDLFPFAGSQNFLARDKELSTFTSNTLGAKLSYDILKNGWRSIDRGSVNLAYDLIWFDYDDFRDARVMGVTPGTEPVYSFTAGVLQLFVSFWF